MNPSLMGLVDLAAFFVQTGIIVLIVLFLYRRGRKAEEKRSKALEEAAARTRRNRLPGMALVGNGGSGGLNPGTIAGAAGAAVSC